MFQSSLPCRLRTEAGKHLHPVAAFGLGFELWDLYKGIQKWTTPALCAAMAVTIRGFCIDGRRQMEEKLRLEEPRLQSARGCSLGRLPA